MFKLKFIVLALFGLLAVGCSSLNPTPTDKSMEEKFRANEADFKKIVTMFREDKLSRLRPDAAYTEPNGELNPAVKVELPVPRMEEYRRLLRQIGSDGMESMSNNQAIILYVFTGKGGWFSSDYREKSYVYSETPPEPIVDSLDQDKTKQIGYKKITDIWYLKYID